MGRNMENSSKKSFVWHHFKKSDIPNHATCDYCKKKCKNTNGNTSGLMFHLLRYHRNSLKTNEANKKVVRRRLKLGGMQKHKYWSSIWKYYEENDDCQTAVCKKCHKEFGSIGNMSTLKRHYLSCYNALELDIKKINVWNHFVNSDDSNQVICKYCNGKYKPNGTTSVLRDHLHRFHKHVLVNQTLVEDLEHVDEDPLKPDEVFYTNTQDEKYDLAKHHTEISNNYDDSELQIQNSNNTNSVLFKGSSCDSNNVTLESNIDNTVTEQESTRKGLSVRASRSFVWNYFERLEHRRTAVCVFCQEEYKTSGGTTNLIQHLVRRHKSLLSSNVDEKYFNYKKKSVRTKISGYECITPIKPKRNCKSFVWLHFQKTNIRHVAICNYCSKTIKTGGSTSGLRYHLMKYHGNQITKADNRISSDTDKILDTDYLLKGITYDGNSIELNLDGDEQTEEPVVSTNKSCDDIFQKKPNGRCKSFVWKHFKKTDMLDKAICNYCSKYCNTTGGNTTGQKFHLLKYHWEQIKNEKVDLTKNTISGKRSFVWDHFEKTTYPNKVVCAHCCKTFISSGNTSNLRDHLIRKHAEEFGKMTNKEQERIIRCEVVSSVEYPQNDDLVETEEAALKKQPKSPRSFVWNHFEQRNKAQKAACKYCKKLISTCGNTTNLRSHFSSCPKRKLSECGGEDIKTFFDEFSKYVSNQEVVENENENEETTILESHEKNNEGIIEEEPQLFSNQYSIALIWKHFVKNEHQYKATCIYCNAEFSRSTSNLWRHLIRFHKDLIDEDLLETAGSRKKCKSLVWNHFEKDENPAKALCNHCGKLCSCCGNTTNLWKHLMTNHREMIESDNAENVQNTEIDNSDINCNESIQKIEYKFLLVDQEDVAKKRTRSAIWNHFDKVRGVKKAICVHCKKTYTTFGNTSNLWAHMLRGHKEVLETLKKEDGVNGNSLDQEARPAKDPKDFPSIEDRDTHPVDKIICTPSIDHSGLVDNTEIEVSENPEIILWDHYLKCRIKGTEKAVCIYCKEEFDSSSVTDLWRHLIDSHADQVPNLNNTDDAGMPSDIEAILLVEGGLKEKVEPLKRGRSQVWDHFDRSSLPQTAVCVYCKESCNTYGNTTSLWNHLMKHHGDLFGISQENEDEEDESEEADEEEAEQSDTITENEKQSGCGNRWSSVWNHFKRDDDLQKTVCVHCDKKFAAYNTTSNLWRHLNASHKEEVSEEEDPGLIREENMHNKKNHIYCVKEYKVLPNSDLKAHLMKHHRLAVSSENAGSDSELFDLYASDEEMKTKETYKSSVWGYFEKIETPQFAVCNYCHMWCEVNDKSFSLKEHLLKYHKDDIRDERKKMTEKPTPDNQSYCLQAHLQSHHEEENAEIQQKNDRGEDVSHNKTEIQVKDDTSQGIAPTKRQRLKSTVWNYFKRLKNLQAVCLYCSRRLKTHGNTSSLWNHLIRFHKNAMDDENSEVLENPKPNKEPEEEERLDDRFESADQETLVNKPKTAKVWRHFDKSMNSQYALCKYCKKLLRCCRGTSNLNKHLRRCHIDVVDEESAKEEETANENVDKLEPIKDVEEFSLKSNYISEEDLKKAKESAGAKGLDDYVILVVT